MEKLATLLRGLAAGMDPARREAIEVVADALSEEAADKLLLNEEFKTAVRDKEALARQLQQLSCERDDLSILLDKEGRDRETAEKLLDLVSRRTWRLAVRRDILTSHRAMAVEARQAAIGVQAEEAAKWVREMSESGPAWPVLAERANALQAARALDALLNMTVERGDTFPCPTCPGDVRFERNT